MQGISFFVLKGQQAPVLTPQQVNFINQLNIKQLDDLAHPPMNIPNTKGLYFPSMKDGKVTIITTNEKRVLRKGESQIDTTIITFKDSLLISAYANNRYKKLQEFKYNEFGKRKHYGKNKIQYYSNGKIKFYQWGSRSKEYIYSDSCITEVFYGRRENFMTHTTQCYNNVEQILIDSSWSGTTKDSIPDIMFYKVARYKYDKDKLIQTSSYVYKNKASIMRQSKGVPSGEDSELFKKWLNIDTLSHSLIHYSYNKLGLLTDRKIKGQRPNDNTLEPEDRLEHVQLSYAFDPQNPNHLTITKNNNTLPVGLYTIIFNKEGYLTKRSYSGHSGRETSGRTFTRTFECFYEME